MAKDEPEGGRDPHGADPSQESTGEPTRTVQPKTRPRLPKKIGQFHVKGVIASGGMGTVYEAVQEHPRRTVAVKVMRHGIASRSAMRRFEYESQLLARLRHPGIAQVYEAGTHDDGTGAVPFFAMEYIPNAKSITQYAGEKKLGTRERLELFAHVCDAVHHGHQKGIVHRDLKPGNILVDSHGEVKIIDFGVARGTDSDMAVTTVQTDIGQLLGTLQYMSPEQCAADPHDIDTRSDVYALGVVLYELLSGKLPYDVKNKPVYETTRVIREQPPTRLSAGDAALRGDIETIAFKALEKDRERRYQSAIELAQDLRRYLAGEAIIARPPSIVYQLRVFARRNKTLFSAVAAVFAVLVAGVIISTSLYVQAERARTQAAEERDRAVAMNDFFRDMLKVVNPSDEMLRPRGRGVTEITATDMLQAAARTIEQRFADQPELEAEVRGALGEAFIDIGDREAAKEHWERALELSERLWGKEDERTLLMRQGYGRAHGQLPHLREAYAGFRRLYGPRHRRTLSAAASLANRLAWVMQLDEAESVLTEALAIGPSQDIEIERQRAYLLGTLAFLNFRQYDFLEAEANARREYELSARIDGPESLAATIAQFRIAYALHVQGRHQEALDASSGVMPGYRRHMGMGHPGTAFFAALVADILLGAGQQAEAEALCLEAIRAQRERFGLAADTQTGTQMAMQRLADLYASQGKLSEATVYAERVLRGLLSLGADADAVDLNNASWTVVKHPDWPPELYALALEAAEKSCDFAPSATRFNTLGIALYRVGRFEDALVALRQAAAGHAESLADGRPEDVAFIAMTLFQLGRRDEALAELGVLRELMTQDRWREDSDAQSCLHQAEALIEAPPANESLDAAPKPLDDSAEAGEMPANAPSGQQP
ncbi:MAG: protein kinase [Phycisphaerales bacterium]|nr:MAG: protein kinase [Phycisphaerales bacterium]